MGKEVNQLKGAWSDGFNSPFEVGLRCVLILLEGRPLSADLQKLVFLDYATVHSGDFDGGPPSLHPSTPVRSAEFLTRRESIEAGLALMMSKGLVDTEFDKLGIAYKATDDAYAFADNLSSVYLRQLRKAAKWAASTLGRKSTPDLASTFGSRATRWGSEFLFMRDLTIDLEGVWSSDQS